MLILGFSEDIVVEKDPHGPVDPSKDHDHSWYYLLLWKYFSSCPSKAKDWYIPYHIIFNTVIA